MDTVYDNSMASNSVHSPASSAASCMAMKIKEEPLDKDDWPESSSRPCSVPTATIQPEPVQKHQRLRYYGRKHVASPDTAVCEVCQGEFRGPDILQIHKLCHFNTSHVCYVCDCYFPNTEVLILHMATNHRNLSTTTGNYKPEAERSFVCVICLQRFSSNKMLMKHQRCHAEKDSTNHACKICALDFVGSKALLAHLSSPRHKEMKVKIQSIFVCVDCRSIFATRDSYAMHMMMRAQSETCNKMEEEDDDVPEKKVMDLLRNSVSENVSAIATSMAMNAMAANGLFLNNLVDMQSSRKSTEQSSQLINSLNNNSSSGLDTNSVPLNLSTTLKQSLQEASRIECSLCFATFPSEDALIVHKTMMHRQDSSSSSSTVRRNPTVSDLLRAQQQLQAASRRYLPTSQGYVQSSVWTCVACGLDLDSCDSLAMHMMEKHANHEENVVQLPDPRLIKQKVEQVYAEASRTSHASKIQAAISPVTQDMRSQSTGIMDEIKAKTSDIKPEKRRLSLQDDVIYKKARAEKFAAICISCGQNFCDKDQFLSHLSKCTTTNESNLQVCFAQCNFCKKQFVSKSQLCEHFLTCSPSNEQEPCNLCGETFTDKHELLQHYRNDHLKLEDNGKQDGAHECKKCRHTFSTMQALFKHARIHDNGSDTRGCPLCGWSTQDKQLYGQHMLLHNINVEDFDLADGRPNGDTFNGMKSDPDGINNEETRRSRRKPLASAKVIPTSQSPDSNDLNHMWSESGSECSTPLPQRSAQPRIPNGTSVQQSPSSGLFLTGAEDLSSEHLLGILMDNVGMLSLCKHCKIIFTDRTMYHLHMGLHNRNDPWQCNLCGKACQDVHEFSSHVLHY